MKKIAPHTFFFLLLSILYGLPLLITLFYEINGNTIYMKNILDSYKETRLSVLFAYILSTTSFLIGSGIANSILNRMIKEHDIQLVLNFNYRSIVQGFGNIVIRGQ